MVVNKTTQLPVLNYQQPQTIALPASMELKNIYTLPHNTRHGTTNQNGVSLLQHHQDVDAQHPSSKGGLIHMANGTVKKDAFCDNNESQNGAASMNYSSGQASRQSDAKNEQNRKILNPSCTNQPNASTIKHKTHNSDDIVSYDIEKGNHMYNSENETKMSTWSLSSTQFFFINPYNVRNYKFTRFFHLHGWLIYILICFYPGVKYMESADYLYMKGEREEAKIYADRSSILFAVGVLLLITVMAFLLFCTVYFT